METKQSLAWLASLAVWLTTSVAFAEPPAVEATNAPSPLALATDVKLEEGPGLTPAKRAYITVGSDKFAFVIPSRFRVELSSNDKFVLVTPDLSATLTFRVVSGQHPSSLSHEQCREWLEQDFPGVKPSEELSLMSFNQAGPAFDAQWNPNGLAQRRARVAYFPSRAGVIEISIVCPSDQYKTLQYDYNFVLLTLRASDEDGRLVVPILSDKI